MMLFNTLDGVLRIHAHSHFTGAITTFSIPLVYMRTSHAVVHPSLALRDDEDMLGDNPLTIFALQSYILVGISFKPHSFVTLMIP